MSIVAMFPGLGADYHGMMGAYLAEYPEDVSNLQKWQAASGLDFWQDEVVRNNIQDAFTNQYCIHALNLLWWKRIGKNTNADIVCGHSLGYYAALVAAEVITEEESFALIGGIFSAALEQFSQQQGDICVITLKKNIDESQFAEYNLEVLANNNPMQFVVYGDKEAIDKYINHTNEKILAHVRMNNIIPFHSSQLKVISEQVSAFIEGNIHLKTPKIPISSHITGNLIETSESAHWHLVNQLHMKVKWSQMIDGLIARDARTFVEIGPNRILSQIVKWIHTDISVRFVDTFRKKIRKTTMKPAMVVG